MAPLDHSYVKGGFPANEIVFIEPSAAVAEDALDCSRSRLKQKQLSVTKGRENDSEPPEPVGAFSLLLISVEFPPQIESSYQEPKPQPSPPAS